MCLIEGTGRGESHAFMDLCFTKSPSFFVGATNGAFEKKRGWRGGSSVGPGKDGGIHTILYHL